jgi:NodT family efflux transporter outer membrane factor (OMF) lipoprotein
VTGAHRAFAGAAAAALVAGCTVGPNFRPPATPEANGYEMPGDDARGGRVRAAIGDKVVNDWWTLFRSPELDEVVREAVAGSPTLAEARARLQAAREAVKAESGQLMIDANAGAERERANLNAFSGGSFSKTIPGFPSFPPNPEFSLYSIGGTVSYNLDPFGGVRRRSESLRASQEEEARELDAAYLTLTGQVVAQAFTIADANLQLEELGDVVAKDQADWDMVKRAHAAGGASDADVAGVESQLAQDQSELPAQRQRREAAKHALAVLLGKAPANWTAPDFTAHSFTMPETLPVSLPSELVHGRPDILQAEASLHAAVAQVGVATANLYPNINLTASLEQTALSPQTVFSPTSTAWTLAAGLTAPIFHSGELKAKQREAQANAQAALAAYELTVLQAFGQVADVLSAIAHDNQAYEAQTRALDAAQARVTMMRRGYAAGGVSELQLVDAERDWAHTRLAVTQQSYSTAGDAALLLLATADVPPGAAAAGQATTP